MDYQELLKDITAFVTQLFKAHEATNLCYHNLQHTQSVAEHSHEIAVQYKLRPSDYFCLMAAAWFHDTGHLKGMLDGHEKASVAIMTDYFLQQPYRISSQLEGAIADCILATRMPTHPTTLAEMIICDADSYHFGTEKFMITDPVLQKELELRTGRTFNNWDNSTLGLLQQHRFYTEYCGKLLNAGKQKNIAMILQRLKG